MNLQIHLSNGSIIKIIGWEGDLEQLRQDMFSPGSLRLDAKDGKSVIIKTEEISAIIKQ